MSTHYITIVQVPEIEMVVVVVVGGYMGNAKGDIDYSEPNQICFFFYNWS